MFGGGLDLRWVPLKQSFNWPDTVDGSGWREMNRGERHWEHTPIYPGAKCEFFLKNPGGKDQKNPGSKFKKSLGGFSLGFLWKNPQVSFTIWSKLILSHLSRVFSQFTQKFDHNMLSYIPKGFIEKNPVGYLRVYCEWIIKELWISGSELILIKLWKKPGGFFKENPKKSPPGFF